MPSEPTVNEILDELARRIDARIPQNLAVDDGLFAHLRLMLDEATQHAHVGEEIPEDARARPVKKALVDGLRPLTSYQRVFNNRVLEVLETLTGLMQAQTATQHLVEPRLGRMNTAVATVDLAIDQIAEQVRELEVRLASIEGRSEGTEWTDPMGQRIEIQSLLGRIQVLEAKLTRVRHAIPDSPAQPVVADATDPAGVAAMRTIDVQFDPDDAELYADLENMFRGSPTTVRALLEPYVDEVRKVGSPKPIVDIGCGRGEWLELLADNDITAYGLDLNPLTVAACVERGLDARNSDAVAHLAELPEASIAAITGFHIVEHLPLKSLLAVIESALVALVPGGALIFETPNCTNLTVGASAFYLDPTHVKPIHPQLLEFICRQRGFDDVEVRFLHPRKPAGDDWTLTRQRGSFPPGMLEELDWAMFGPMDYALVARKADAI